MIPSVFIVGEGQQIAEMFLDEHWYVTETLSTADLVQFTGGHDVNPGMYGEKAHDATWSWPKRDTFEFLVWELARREGRAIAGICRGGQFLNVVNGGRMWQDVDGHGISGMHKAKCKIADDELNVTSTHHQMMRVGPNSELLMTANCSSWKERISKKGGVVKVMNDTPDVEAVFYPKTWALCFQPHPEYKHVSNIAICKQRYFDYLDTFFQLRV